MTTCTVQFNRVVFELCERTHGQTDILITILCTPTTGEVTTHHHIMHDAANNSLIQ